MAKNPYLKDANQVMEYTAEQVLEIQKCMTDPVYFAERYCHIQHPVKGSVPVELYPYQKRMLYDFRDNRNTIVLSARQTGKALTLTTPIPTPSGWTTMGDISVGSVVFGKDGKPTTVTAVTDTMHNHECFRVTFACGEYIDADADHQWEVMDKFTRQTVVKTTRQLAVDGNGPRPGGKTCRYSVAIPKALDLPNQPLLIDPYVLGTWLGGGHSSRAEWTVHEDDISIYKHHPNFSEYRVLPTARRSSVLRVCYQPLNQSLKELGVQHNKHIPVAYLRSSYAQRLSLLQGLMDTDGTIDKTRGGCELTLSNDVLANQAYELICSLGLKPTMSSRVKSGVKTNSITFTPYRNDIEVFRLQRKLCRQKQSPAPTRAMSTKQRSILSVTPIESQPVRCITVDAPDHLFLAGRAMIPTHNSTMSCIYLLWYAIFHFEKTILIASNKNDNAMEMIHRIKFVYERLPHWLKPGLAADGYNKHSIGFDNGSRIHSQATTENTGRGMSISLLFCLGGDTKITVRNKNTGKIQQFTLAEMYKKLLGCDVGLVVNT